MTNGMVRLVAALEGRRADRVPVFCNLLDQGARFLGIPHEEYYASGEAVAEGQLLMREHFGYDNLWSLFYVGKEAELLGCRDILYASDGPPNVASAIIQGPDDIRRLEVPDDVFEHPGFREIRRCISTLRREAGGRHPICAYVTASMSLPALLMGMEKWMELLLLGPGDLRDELLEKCSLFFQREIEAYRKAGADVLLYSNPFGSLDTVPTKLFRELSMPWMKRDLGPGGISGVVYYCGSSRMNRVIEDVIRELGITTFYLSPFDDLAEAERLLAGRGLACGTIEDLRLVHSSPERIRADVARIMATGKQSPRFLFGTLLMPMAIPEPIIHALLQSAYELGAWPAAAEAP
ncbi:uroporphyrinogen decarboxylase family protein [Myxococcota bacterium]|nr:uroporphyrinogen decarboxylase family protein [Myxococcota bacterium]